MTDRLRDPRLAAVQDYLENSMSHGYKQIPIAQLIAYLGLVDAMAVDDIRVAGLGLHPLLTPVETDTYSIRFINNEIAIECKLCDAPPSYHRGDVTHRFCARCNLFLDTLEVRDSIHISHGCEACVAYRGE